MPLPPYIKERLEDQDRYQTVYAREEVLQQHQRQVFILQKNYLQEIEEKGVHDCIHYSSCRTWNF